MDSFAGVPRQARPLTYCGYEVKIGSPRFVKPFIKTNKTDANDARAICVVMDAPLLIFRNSAKIYNDQLMR